MTGKRGIVSVLNPGGRSPGLLVCEHASNYIPEEFQGLGVSPIHADKHWFYDIGTENVTRQLSADLDATAILATHSRLVVDLNRPVDHPTTFAQSGEGTPIPGNEHLDLPARKKRLDLYYHPFHRKVSQTIDSHLARGFFPVLLSIHSFTPVFYGISRPWEIGILWLQDADLPSRLIEMFTKMGFAVGDNEPYDGRLFPGTTVNRHGDARGLPNALIEIRNDLIDTPDKARDLAKKISPNLKTLLSDPSIFRYYDGPERLFDPGAVRPGVEEASPAGKEA